MLKLYQTKFGGKNSLIEGQGNCFQACVATILQMPLEEAFNHASYADDEWMAEFNN